VFLFDTATVAAAAVAAAVAALATNVLPASDQPRVEPA